jgi:hypothetical protein
LRIRQYLGATSTQASRTAYASRRDHCFAAFRYDRGAGKQTRRPTKNSRGGFQKLTVAGHAALEAMITHQAQIIAYIDEFKLLMIWMLVVNPLLTAFRRAGGGKDQTLVME